MKQTILSSKSILENKQLITHLQKVTPENLPAFEHIIKNSPKGVCSILCTTPTPEKFTGRPYEGYYCGGYDLKDTARKDEAIQTLNGLLSLPEHVGNVLCQII